MTHNETINSFVERDYESRYIIEPARRHELVDNHLRKALDACKPSVAVKAGAGAGDLLMTIAEKSEHCICVEPSMKIIEKVSNRFKDDQRLKKVQFINANFAAFPIDYYKADLLVCIDNFDFILSGLAMEEFKRATQFEGMFFFGGVVLHNEDIEGIYDEFVKLVNPLHNDYYLEGDFRTFMHLKDYSAITDGTEKYRINLKEYISYWENQPDSEKKINASDSLAFIESNKEIFKTLYELDENLDVTEYYLTGLYRKNRFKETPAEI